MIRTFGQITLGATSQPWFGDVTTAAIAAPVNSQYILVPVANTAIYQVGDRIILNPAGPVKSVLKVNQIVSSTVLQCQSEGYAEVPAYATATVIALAINCWKIDFQNTGSDPIYLGADDTVTSSGGGSAFRELLAAATDITNAYSIEKSTGQNSLNTDEGWMAGSGTILIAAHVN